MFKFKEYKYKSFSFLLLLTVYTLGAISVYLISILQDADEDLYQKQMLGYLAGLVVIFAVSMVDYHFLGKLFWLWYIAGVGLLLICRFSHSYPIYGWAHYDARRWIKIGGDPSAGIHNTGFEFLASEPMKIALIVFLAKFFELVQKYIKKFWVLALSAIFMALPTVLILTQTDLSTSIVFALFYCVMVFASGVPYRILLPVIGIAAPIGAGLFWYVQQDFQILLKYYQQKRILAALHPEAYPELTYQQDNARAAIVSGGVLGKTLTGDTSFRGTNYVPVKESDFIFTAVAEEFGFVGSIAVLAIYFILILLIIRIARRAKDKLGFLIALGIGALLSFQVFINIGVVSSLLPNTGIPLPFMSAGLTSLLINLVMIGILLNISMQPKEDTVKTEEEEFDFLDQ